MLFMSVEHVARMNDLLARSDEINQICAALPGEHLMLYELKDGPGGAMVYWTLRVGPRGARFGLEFPGDARQSGVTICADWGDMVRSARAARENRRHAVDMRQTGDETALAFFAGILDPVRRAALVDCEFPEV